jgi:hypothetical protein
VNTLNKKSEHVRNILLACFLFGALFCISNHHFSKSKQKAESEKQQEYVAACHSPVISENHTQKISKPSYSISFSELSRENSNDKNTRRQLTFSEQNFLQVKILLKLSIYNQYFASGLHEPPLAA